ncbi:YecR-like lipoprotein [compost metagenome]
MRAISLAALALATAVAVTGCATKKNFYAMGGSRADGTVDMAYDFRQFEKPVINMDQAKGIAKSKCQVWGYQDAEMFGGQRQQCYQFDGWGNCAAGQVVIQYQCIGSGDSRSAVSAYAPAPTAAPAATPGSLSRDQWKQQQLQKLDQETGLSYEEYQRRYREIVGQ